MQMNNEKVSVIVTVLNAGSELAPLLDSLLCQTREPDEVVVVDGGSTDGTVDVLKRYAQRETRLTFFVEPGTNIARGRNIAIGRSSFDILAVTDAGCRPDRDWLKELVKPLVRDETIYAVAGAIEVCGLTHRLYQEISPGYGFDGIAVALLVNNSPLGCLLSGILFGALRSGSEVMQMNAQVPSVLVYVIQGLVLLAAAGFGAFRFGGIRAQPA